MENNKMYNIINVENTNDFKMLYDESALTLEGLDEEYFVVVCSLLKDRQYLKNETEPLNMYLISGENMNKEYKLKYEVAYPNELNIVAIPLNQLTNISKLAIDRFDFGGRWFDDVVENNERNLKEIIKNKQNTR